MKLVATLLCAWVLVACGGGGSSQTPSSGVTTSYALGGGISGLGSAIGLTLTNGTESLPIPANATTFTFTTQISQNTNYNVAVASQPVGLMCSINGGVGTMAGANVNTVAVTCIAPPPSVIEPPTLALFAGNLGGPGNIDGDGAKASFFDLGSIATDTAGNAYVTDMGNFTIRKITPTGVVSTLAGTPGVRGNTDGIGAAASFDYPNGIATDSAGNVYVADTVNNTIRKITPAGVVSTLTGAAGAFGSSNAIGLSSRFSGPTGFAFDSAGNLYVADNYNFTIRMITPAGIVSTLAGTTNHAGSADGIGTAASFGYVSGITSDSDGNLYVADFDNHTIRMITPAGVVSTLAGTAGVSGSADGIGTAASFGYDSGITIDSAGNLYVADSNNFTIRKITSAGVVSTLAGTAGVSGSADGIGAAARFNYLGSIATDSMGNALVAEGTSVRKITLNGVVSTLAGSTAVSGSVDGTGATAGFNYPIGIATDAMGNVYVGDTGNFTVRKITPIGIVSTLAGTPGVRGSTDGIGATASFDYIRGIAADAAGNVYVADSGSFTIRKITPAGVVSTLAGTAYVYGHADGVGAAARFDLPIGIATDSAGNVYVTDSEQCTRSCSPYSYIRKITPAGVVSTLAQTTAPYILDPKGIAVDSAGNVYLADPSKHAIGKITPAGVLSTLAGAADVSGSADGIGAAASFEYPSSIAVDSAGSIYVADDGNHTVRKITPAGVVSTLVGVPDRVGFSPGALPGNLYRPRGLAISGTRLYITMENGVAVVSNLR